MKTKELREKSVAELDKLLRDSTQQLFTMRTTSATGAVEKSHLFSSLRRDIARINTIIRQKQA